MWARIMEFMLAAWLAVSQFIFAYPPGRAFERASDLVCAVLIAGLALASIARPMRHLHLGNLLVGLWLIGVAVFASTDNPPGAMYQNYMVFALTLGMITIVPSRSDTPPDAWLRYYESPNA